MVKPRLLLIDDEAGIRVGMRAYLEAKGYEVDEAGSCAEAEARARAIAPDAVVLDFLLGDGTALEVLPRLRALHPSVPVVLLTAHGSIDMAVQTIKLGAEQFLVKPVEMPALEIILRRTLEADRSKRRQAVMEARTGRANPFLGKSPAIRAVEERARRIVDVDRPVLILGETGTGKGLLARWIHENGPRASEPFVDLNCAGLSAELLESELFGHEKGAFTGAVALKVGLFEVAHRGTLFLDELGDMPEPVQPKLLKVLEDKRFRRLGHVRDHTVDARLIAATHRDLAAQSAEGRFRQDLYFRISTLPLMLPALRERAEDIPEIASELLRRLGRDLGRGALSLAGAATAALCRHPWPGNVRELRNVLERAVLLSRGDTLGVEDLDFGPQAPGTARSVPVTVGAETLADVERQHITRILGEENGRVEAAARRLALPRSTLYQKLKQYGLSKRGN